MIDFLDWIGDTLAARPLVTLLVAIVGLTTMGLIAQMLVSRAARRRARLARLQRDEDARNRDA